MKHIIHKIIVIFTFIYIVYPKQHKGTSVTFIILNQNEKGHIQRANDLRDKILMHTSYNDSVNVLTATDDFPDDAAWTFFPIMEKLDKMNYRWYVFLEEYADLDVKNIISFLSNYDHLENHFIGNSLVDREPTIIHHFDSIDDKKKIVYPDLRAGFIISTRLLKTIDSTWNDMKKQVDFSIDSSYEFSKFLFKFGIKLKQSSHFCVKKKQNCFIWQSKDLSNIRPADLNGIYFAVKTCKKFAFDRIPILKDTWLSDAPRYQLYSDTQDQNLGTIDIGVNNTEKGHCSKTIAIIKHVSKLNDINWLAIVDDDTLINTRRLSSFLGNYLPSTELALGERYGYMQSINEGFSYVTGGGGIILSFPLVVHLSQPGICTCPVADSPDDMILGLCLARIKVPIIHSRRFHQARADDYPTALLMNCKPISFHKFWMIDPRQSYKSWLVDGIHDEL